MFTIKLTQDIIFYKDLLSETSDDVSKVLYKSGDVLEVNDIYMDRLKPYGEIAIEADFDEVKPKPKPRRSKKKVDVNKEV